MAKITIYYTDLERFLDYNSFNTSNLTFKKEKDDNEVYERYVCDGKLEVYGAEYTQLAALKNANISEVFVNIYDDGELQVFGALQLMGNQAEFDDNSKKCSLNFVTHDQYKDLLENIDKKTNILNAGTINTVFASVAQSKLEFSETAFTENNALGSLWYTFEIGASTVQIYARERRDNVSDSEKEILLSAGQWEELDGTPTTLIREWSIAFPPINFNPLIATPTPDNIDDVTSSDSGGSSTGETINDQFPETSAFLSAFTFITERFISGTGTYAQRYLINSQYYTSENIIYARCRDFIEVIKLLVNEADSSLTFDSDSFKYLTDREYLADLQISTLSDVLFETSNAATSSELTLNVLFDFLKTAFYLYYEIEVDVDGNKIFRLVHRTEQFNQAASVRPEHDLTTLYGINWSKGVDVTIYQTEDRFNRLARNTIAKSPDFIGKDITFSRVQQNNTKEVSIQGIYTDLPNIQRNPSDYPNSIKDFALFTTDDTPVMDDITTYTPFDPQYANLLSYFLSDFSFPFYRIHDIITYKSGIGSKYKIPTEVGVENFRIATPFSANAAETIYIGMTFDVDTDVTVKLISGYFPGSLEADTNVHATFTPPIGTIWTHVAESTRTDYRVIVLLQNGSAERFINKIIVTKENVKRVRTGTGAITGDSVQNVEVSIANIDESDLADCADVNAAVNDTAVVLNENQTYDYREQKEILVPVPKLASSFDFGEFVKTDLTDEGRLKSVQKKAGDNAATVRISY